MTTALFVLGGIGACVVYIAVVLLATGHSSQDKGGPDA